MASVILLMVLLLPSLLEGRLRFCIILLDIFYLSQRDAQGSLIRTLMGGKQKCFHIKMLLFAANIQIQMCKYALFFFK